jgi:hypothetical protein
MNKWERTYTKGDMPLYMYKISEFMVNKFGVKTCEKGISVEGVILKNSWTTFDKEQKALNDLLYDTNKEGKGYIDYRVFVSNTNKVIKESVYRDVLESKIKAEINKEIDKEMFTGYSV